MCVSTASGRQRSYLSHSSRGVSPSDIRARQVWQVFDSILKTNKRRSPNAYCSWTLKKKSFLTNHLIIAIAFAHPNLSPSLFITAATLSEASSPPHLPPSHHRDPPHPPPWPPMFFALRPPWGTPCWTVRCVGT